MLNKSAFSKTAFSKAVFSVAFSAAGLMAILTAAACSPQDDESSRREANAIKQVQSAGGRVYRISAEDESREISFNLSSTPIGDKHLEGINSIGNVIWLNLAGTKVTDSGLKHLVGLPLKKLHLERTEIGDAGLEHLESFEELEYLNLYQTKVSDAGIERLAKLKGLKRLYVWNSAITDEGIEKLRKQLPDAQIVGALKLEPVVVEAKEKPEKEMDQAAGEKTDAANQPDAKKKAEKQADDDEAEPNAAKRKAKREAAAKKKAERKKKAAEESK